MFNGMRVVTEKKLYTHFLSDERGIWDVKFVQRILTNAAISLESTSKMKLNPEGTRQVQYHGICMPRSRDE